MTLSSNQKLVAIVNTGGANLASLQNAFTRLQVSSVITADIAIIQTASHVVFPGVGAAFHAMTHLKKCQLVSVLKKITQPVLGICLGMQLFFEHSDEGDTECLGLISGSVTLIPQRSGFPVPHMGWNNVNWNDSAEIKLQPLMYNIPNGTPFYFVHSYQAPLSASVLAYADYSSPLPALVRERNYWGVQFHPERSGPLGALLLQNFLNLKGDEP